MPVKNYMEDAVFELIDDILEGLDQCTCELCRADIAAIALNNLETRYYASSIGGVYNKVNKLVNQFEADITREIVEAAKVVRKNKRHE